MKTDKARMNKNKEGMKKGTAVNGLRSAVNGQRLDS
jgi:hypothetical protein